MKTGYLKLVAGVIAICTLLSGCKSQVGNTENKKVACGSYVEEKIVFDQRDDERMPECHFFENRDGDMEVMTYVPKENKIKFYTLNDSGEWLKADEELSKSISNERFNYIQYIQKDVQTNEIYFMVDESDADGHTSHRLVHVKADNSLEEIAIDWSKEERHYAKIVVDNGILYALSVWTISESSEQYDLKTGNYIEQYDLKTGNYIHSFGQGVLDFTILNNKIYAKSVKDEKNVVECYDSSNAKMINSVEINISGQIGKMLTSEDKKGIYIICDDGIFYFSEEGGMPEKLVEGKQFTMSSPNSSIEDAFVKNGIFYVQYCLANEFVCKSYRYDKGSPIVSKKKMTIFSLERCRLLQNAVQVYSQQHPEMSIELNMIQNVDMMPLNEEEKNQAIEAVNASILSGEAPDIIVLDGLPIESYIEQGALGDMTSILDGIEKKENYYNNLLRTYEKDEKLYALPLSCKILSAVGKKELVSEGFSLERLAEYQRQHPNEKVLGNILPEDLLQEMSTVWQTKIINDEGKIQEKELKVFLESIHTLAPDEVDRNDIDAIAQYYQPYRTWQAINNEIDTTIEVIDSTQTMQMLLHANNQLNEGIIAPNIEGNKDVICLSKIIGVSAKTSCMNEIQELLRLAYSKEVMEKEVYQLAMIKDINEQYILGELEIISPYCSTPIKNKEGGINFGVGDGKGGHETKHYNIWYADEAKYYIEALRNEKVLIPMEEQVLQIIQREAKSYFKDEISVEEAVGNIKQKVDIYLSEQEKYHCRKSTQ